MTAQPSQNTNHPEILRVPDDATTVSCNGGGGPMGHPKVFYTFDHQDDVVCGYCDRLFTKHDMPGAKPYVRGS